MKLTSPDHPRQVASPQDDHLVAAPGAGEPGSFRRPRTQCLAMTPRRDGSTLLIAPCAVLLALLAPVVGAAQTETMAIPATVPSAAQPDDKGANLAQVEQDGDRTVGQIDPGMPIARALELLGQPPDQTVEIGAACGMLEIMTWRQLDLKVIGVGGVVTSVSDQ